MKSHLFKFLFLYCFCCLSNVSAQTSFGIKGQVNNISAPLVVKSDLLSKPLGETFNPGFGLFFEFNLNKRWAIQPEINYQEQRKSYLLSGGENKINTSILEYIRVPILFKYKIPFNGWNLTGMLGPNPGYGMKLKSGETNFNLQYTEYQTLDFNEYQVNRFDFGLLTGLGVEKFVANKFKTSLALRYDLGFIDIMKDDLSTFYTRGYSLEIAFMIPFDFVKPSKEESSEKQLVN